jgi:hypothetical protein
VTSAGPHSRGRLVPMPSHLTTPQRFWAKVDKDGPIPEYAPHLGPCWLWTRCLVRGHGQFTSDGHKGYAHRWAYEQEHGPIPPHLECDHLCRIRSCVRSSHIELVTNRVNVLRGVGLTAQNRRKTQCVHGHPFDEANTRHRPDGGRPGRECRACVCDRDRARRRAA